jgi:hypothetical protein
MASVQHFQMPRAGWEMIILNDACILHIILQALCPGSSSLTPETTLPDGYDYPQFVDEETEVHRGGLTPPKS